MSITVNDLIGLNYANLRNPQPVDMAPGLSYQIDPTAQGGRRLVGATPTQNPGANLKIAPSNLMPDPEFPEYLQVVNNNYSLTPDFNTTQPTSKDTTGIVPLLQQEMPLDFEEMIQEDRSIVPQKNKGLNSLLQLALSAAIPGAGLFMRGARGLAGLNRRLQQSDFGQSSSLVDYLNRKRRQSDEAIRNRVQTRGIQKKIDSGMYDDKDPSGIGDRGRGQITSSSPPPRKTSSNYKTASYDRRTTKY
jgi:hypothetical protein